MFNHPAVSDIPSQSPPKELRPRATLMIVDGEPANLSVLAGVLQPHYRVRAANSGARALESAVADPVPDLILLDVMMPAMDGYTVLARLREHPATRDIPVIFVTALSDTADEELGLALGAVVAFEDITERQRMQAELAQHRQLLEQQVVRRTAELAAAEARVRLILDSSADGIYGVDREGVATFINPAACKLLGYAPDAVIGRSMHGLIHHSRADGRPFPEADCPMTSSLRDGKLVRDDDGVFWHADGHAIPVTFASHPMLEGEHIVGAVVSFFDNSAQKAAQFEAERLARLKHAFLANMSHEIRTPLNAVLGFAEIGLRDNEDGKNADRFGRIVKAGRQLLSMVNDILDLSQIEAGKLSLEAGDIDVRALIAAGVDRIRASAHAKGLALRIELAPELPRACRADGVRLRQALANLLDNAVKFTEAGGIVLTARYEAATLILQVVDSGIGISETQRQRLFQAFEQADGSTQRKFNGTGLGLALTQRLVELMGGEIRVSSAPGQGCTFELRLPCAASLVAASALPDEPRAEALPAALETLPDPLRGNS